MALTYGQTFIRPIRLSSEQAPQVAMDEDPTHSQLDVTVLGDVSREVTYTSGGGDDVRKRNVTMWKKKRSITVHVHVEETSTGTLRVIKKVKPHSPQVKDWRPEIQLMGRASDASKYQFPYQLLQGLAKLHEMAITHRDIKPQNILVVTKESPFPKYQTLADHCRGLVPYLEISLTRRGISLSGRLFIKKLMVLDSAGRPAASVELMSNWVVTETADISPNELDWDREEFISSENDNDILSTDGWRNHVAAEHTLFSPNNPSTDQPSTTSTTAEDDVIVSTPYPVCLQRILLIMNQDYHTSELWHILETPITALHLATSTGSINRVEILLEYGAKGSIRTQPHGETALHLATFNFDLDRYSRSVWAYAVNPNIVDSQGRTALHYAAAASGRFSSEFIHDLIKIGADVNQVDNSLKTPLHEAVEAGKGKVIRALVDAGADTKVGDLSFEGRLQRVLFWGGISEKLPCPLGSI
ncbi:ankyrin repeat and protein kinase domain-containing protein [Aspergillus affinis]|uniref:ankyrin repeat and protein kinase domain-containing protein n=1 Tax=Aspergillus affinis TaxID=1070780 RepID=UPI0022FE929A|nr:kinase-like domain-containing protein [Aspergillus affinis]KAI9037045.1 kinase-like domain-containing protein [Aspergillus affinis]